MNSLLAPAFEVRTTAPINRGRPAGFDPIKNFFAKIYTTLEFEHFNWLIEVT